MPEAARVAAVEVAELRDRAAIASLREEWDRLRREVAAAGGVAGPFLAPEWFAVQAASLAPDSLRLLVAHRAGRLAAVLPLLEETRRLSGLPARVLRSLSDDHSQRFDLLCDGDDAASALLDHLRRDKRWDALELRDVPVDAPSGAARLTAAARLAGLPTAQWPAMRSPWMRLEENLNGGSKNGRAKFRANLRRRRKKLEAEKGPIALERIDGRDRAALRAALDDGFRLEAAGWKGAAGTAIACDPALSARYAALAGAFAALDRLSLYFLVVGGVRKAFHFALEEDGVYYLFKPGFDPELSNYGLGHLLIDEVCRDLETRAAHTFDFLGDDMPWKREWTGELRAHSWRYVFADSVRGRALHAWKFRLAPRLKELSPRLADLLPRR
jgi:CelD/BcsL family acetyltransferase involved in cellulose biosynthesis